MEESALKIWHALNVLAEIPMDPAAHQKMLTAEMLLLNLMLELLEKTERSFLEERKYGAGSTVH